MLDDRSMLGDSPLAKHVVFLTEDDEGAEVAITLPQYLDILLTDVENRDLEEFSGNLSLVPPTHDAEIRTYIFTKAAGYALRAGWGEGATAALQMWFEYTDPISLLIAATAEGFFDDEELRALIVYWQEELSLTAIIETIITGKDFGPTMEISTALDRLWKLLKVKPTLDEINSLLDLADKKAMGPVYDFLLLVKPEISPEAAVPKHIVVETPLRTDPELRRLARSVTIKLPEFKTRADFIAYLASSTRKGLIKVLINQLANIPEEGVRDNLKKMLSAPGAEELVIRMVEKRINEMTDEEFQRDIEEYVNNIWVSLIEEQPDVIRILGPRNSDPNEPPGTPESEDITSYRMLTDMTRDGSEDNYGRYAWFLGHCQMCYQRIPKICYAVRLPMPSGGWTGCFCSFEHIHSWLNKSESYDEAFKKTLHQLTYDTEGIILSTGILDRIYPDELDLDED